MIGLAVVDAAANILNTFMAVKVAQNFAADIRSAAFRKIQSFSFRRLHFSVRIIWFCNHDYFKFINNTS